MKLFKFQIQNARLIKTMVIEITKENGVIEFAGMSQQGKTTILDMVQVLLEGKSKFRTTMISQGEGSLKLIGELSDGYEIKRSFTEKSDRLEVKRKVSEDSNFTVSNAQTFLNKMISHIAIRPMDFVNAKPADKVQMLLKEADLDFREIDKKIKDAEQDRLFIGRSISAMGNPVLPELDDDKKERVDTAQLLKEKRLAEFLDTLQSKVKRARQDLVDIMSDIQDDYDELKDRMNDLDSRAEKNFELFQKWVDIFKGKLEKSSQPELESINVEPINKKFASASEVNSAIDNYEAIKRKVETKKTEEKKYEEKSKEIDTLRKKKKKMLDEADFGLNVRIEEEGLYIDDIFSEEWSKMQALKYAVMIGVRNAKLRIVAIDGYETFDPVQREKFNEWCLENEIQALVTTVQMVPEDPKDDKFYIEGGEIIYHNAMNDNDDKESEQKKNINIDSDDDF